MPLLDRILVQRVKAESKTASGIFLPESSVKELNEGKVLAVGPGALDKEGKRVPMSVAVGDRVLIPQVSRPAVSRLCWTRVGKLTPDTSTAAAPSRWAKRNSRCSATTSKFGSFC